MKRTLKLGTRKSLLAWAQSSWVAGQVEKHNPEISVELVGIETRGDVVLDVSLQSLQGKEFFVAEIDDALRSSAVDFTVHSMKDLSLDRPPEFVLGCVPKRENPRDVVLFGPGVMEKIGSGKKLRIGTSSPRRLENLPSFLSKALPTVAGREPQTEFVEIRGNVNTRLSRVHESEGAPKRMDGVVLAFAGLIRLWADEKGRAELTRLLLGVRWMVVPVKENPTAPAQGALAVECRADDQDTLAALRKFHDLETETSVRAERQILADWGGGCHQRFGATYLSPSELGGMLFIRGAKPSGAKVDELRWSPFEKGTMPAGRVWDGSEHRGTSFQALPARIPPGKKAAFVVHYRAAAGLGSEQPHRVWTSGSMSWFKLARQGLWVEGSAEGMGFEFQKPTLSEPVLQLPELRDWVVLTHDRAVNDWTTPVGFETAMNAVATYHVDADYSEAAKTALNGASQVFWTSSSQFDELKNEVSQHAVQACGPGKTAAYLRRAGIKPVVFPSVEEWKKWVKTQASV